MRSETFSRWLHGISDRRAVARIAIRIDRLADGNFGDHKSVGGGVSELRIQVGKGYRVYYTIRQRSVVILLQGGHKSTQRDDIARARLMANEV